MFRKLTKFEKLYVLFCIVFMLSVATIVTVYEAKVTQSESMSSNSGSGDITYHIKGSNTIIMHTTEPLFVRNFPSTKGGKIGVLLKNRDVTVTGICDESGWYRIDYDDGFGYISNEYVKSGSISAAPSEDPDPVNHFVQGETGVSDEMVLGVEAEYNMVPKNVRDYLEASGWTITVSAQNITERYNKTGDVLGITSYLNKKIMIDNREVAKSAVIHEVGHYIDFENDFVSESDEFVSIYEAEKDAFCAYRYTADHNTSEPREYFAESYYSCINDPDGMKTNCPKTYEFVMNVSNSIQGLPEVQD